MHYSLVLTATDDAIKQYTKNTFLNNFLNKFDFDQILWNLTTKVISIILISVLFLIIAETGKKIIAHFFKKYQIKMKSSKSDNPIDNSELMVRRRNKTIYTLTQNAFYYLVIFFWLYSILSIIGIPVGTLIAGAGIFSLAIGLGAQGFVSDIVSGFFIIFEHQIDVGEHVIINSTNGIVAAIGLRTTQIRSQNGTLNFIPNRDITTISNLSRGNISTLVNIRIMPDSPIKQIEDIMADVNEKLDGSDANVIGLPVVFGTVYLTDGSLAIQTVITARSGTESKVQAIYLAAYLKAINDANIALPMSPQTVKVPAKPQKKSKSATEALPISTNTK
ncbi:mechanosensitive ion channel family protein [Fructilactobacillus sp. Tb1]|uniref:mechanosensitive ion channel family protein n=1 Tax=Fructilactobacillus sp. Tb1 TaxID=3422304 RepID=UPI003D27E3C0